MFEVEVIFGLIYKYDILDLLEGVVNEVVVVEGSEVFWKFVLY